MCCGEGVPSLSQVVIPSARASVSTNQRIQNQDITAQMKSTREASTSPDCEKAKGRLEIREFLRIFRKYRLEDSGSNNHVNTESKCGEFRICWPNFFLIVWYKLCLDKQGLICKDIVWLSHLQMIKGVKALWCIRGGVMIQTGPDLLGRKISCHRND